VLFVGTNLLDTSIPTVVCYVGTNLLTSLPSVSFAFHSLVYFMFLSSPNLLCIYYFCFHRIFALVTFVFIRCASHSLLVLLPNQLDNHSFCWIFLVLTPCAFTKSTWQSLLLLDLLGAHSLCFRQIYSTLGPSGFFLPSPDLLGFSSSSVLYLHLQVFLTRIPDLFTITPDLIFANI
jgi:hypothetical protein